MGNALTKAEKTRQHIIETTAPAFNIKGFAATSLTDLTAASGLSKGCIYGHFEDKDQVALAAFDYNFAKINSYMKAKILSTENSVDRLLMYPRVYRDFLKIPFLKAGCPLLNTATEADDTHPGLREKACAALSYWKTSLENQIKRGIERKEIKSTANAPEITAVIISMIEGAVMQAKLVGKPTELRLAMGYLEKIILNLKA
jgi:AcrR family transcriptional regulator